MKRGIIGVMTLAAAAPAMAHDAPTGWSYDAMCCSTFDCRQVEAKTIRETPAGFLVEQNGETVPYTSYKVKDSPDGLYHLCTSGGSDRGKTLCVYVPPRAY